MDTFPTNYAPLEGPVGTVGFRVRSAQFGDSYMQETPDGLNPVTRTWPVKYQGLNTDAQTIANFLEAHVGIKFLWTPPLGVQGTYNCTGYTVTHLEASVWNVDVTFKTAYGV